MTFGSKEYLGNVVYCVTEYTICNLVFESIFRHKMANGGLCILARTDVVKKEYYLAMQLLCMRVAQKVMP